MKIIELNAENIKKLKAIRICPDEKNPLVLITGKNDQGKTSVLDCILFALGGEKCVQDKPIRAGEDHGEINIDIGKYKIKRIFSESGSRLEIRSAEGALFSSPQSLLNKITGELSFDPLEFAHMDSKKRLDLLKKLTGVDTSLIELKKKGLYDERTDINRELAKMDSQVDKRIIDGQLPEEEILARELVAKISTESERISKLNNEKTRKDQLKKNIDELEKKLIELKTMLHDTEVVITDHEALGPSRLDSLNAEFFALEEMNRKIRDNNILRNLKKKRAQLNKESDDLTAKIDECESERQQMILSAQMPIAGLSFTEDGVFFNDIPFEQINDAGKLRVSLAVGMALNPQLRVIRITNGSLLDSENLKIVQDLAKEKDYQIWLEKVTDGGQCGIVIEDGEVKGK